METLHLVPVPIAEGQPDGSALRVLPPTTVEIARQCRYFLAENARSARAFLRAVGHPGPIADLQIVEIGHEPDPLAIDHWLAPLRSSGAESGTDAILLSEAGCPGIADPGATLVARAHELGIRVAPWVGPSSIVLALMGAGMNGQHFRFLGYLPQERGALRERLRAVQVDANRGETQIFIETPYRNVRLFEAILQVCEANTRLGLAIELTAANQTVLTRTIAQWQSVRASASAALDRHAAVFLVAASTARALAPRAHAPHRRRSPLRPRS